jgi:hypothetical protein
MQRTGKRHDLLGSGPLIPEFIQSNKESLMDGWEIVDRESFYESLRSLDEGGHRASFESIATMLEKLDDQKFNTLVKAFQANEERLNKYKVARDNAPRLKQKSLLGWDFSRYIAVCRWGYLCGYVTEEEAWKLIMPKARLLQQTFDSWEDLADNYVVGFKFWSLEHTRHTHAATMATIGKLLNDPTSPWLKYPWNTALGTP